MQNLKDLICNDLDIQPENETNKSNISDYPSNMKV